MKRAPAKRVRDLLGCYLPLPWYYGRGFRRDFAFLKQSSDWKRDRLIEYKLAQLRKLVSFAEQHVPYYTRVFAEYGINSADIRTLDDFSRLPLLTKDLVTENLKSLKADDFDSHNPVLTATSGTTGKAMKLYRSQHQEEMRLAQFWRELHRHGFRFGDRQVKLESPKTYDPDTPLYYHDRIENALVINTYHVLAGRQGEVLEAIRQFKPKLLQGLPNILFIVADHAIEHNLEPLEIPFIVLWGEKLYPHLNAARERIFPGKLIEYFANRENTIAAWGSGDDRFSEVSEYCHLEVLPTGAPGDDGSTGDLITTSLHNYAFPLIRYNSADLVKWEGYVNHDSRRPELELIGGRGKDLLLSRDGYLAPHLYSCLRRNRFYKVRRCQVEQIDLDRVIVRVVAGPDYERAQDEPVLLKIISEGLLDRFQLQAEYVDEITFTKRGKFRPVISDLATRQAQR